MASVGEGLVAATAVVVVAAGVVVGVLIAVVTVMTAVVDTAAIIAIEAGAARTPLAFAPPGSLK